MKKKILAIIAALTCVSAGAIGLTACGGDDGGENSTRIYLVRSDGTELENGANLGECMYMGDFSSIFDIKVCTKNADGTFVELTENDVTVTYLHNGDVIDKPTSIDDFAAGSYSMNFKYNGSTTTAYFTVKKSDKSNIALTLSKSEWKFGEQGAAVTVKEGATDITDQTDRYNLCYISVDEYDKIKDGDGELSNILYYVEEPRDMTPGSYYIYANYNETDNYDAGHTDFVPSAKVTVKKGDLTIRYAELLSSEPFDYSYSETADDIKLSDIIINDYTLDDQTHETTTYAYATNGYGDKVDGEFVWQNPNNTVNATKSGNAYPVKFVAYEESYPGYYNEKSNVGEVKITIHKCGVSKPQYTNEDFDFDSFEGYGFEITYDGKAHDVYVGSYNYYKFVNVTRDGQKMDVKVNSNGSIIDKVTDVGTYVYTISLKNKNNLFFWTDEDEEDIEDVTFTYVVKPIKSYVNYRGDMPLLVPDNNGEISLEIAPYISPYVAGTLTAEYDESAEDKSIHTADVRIVTEGGKDYLKISNIQNNPAVAGGGAKGLPIKLTAKGDKNYADIDCTTYNFVVEFDIDISMHDLIIYKDVTVGELYEVYPNITTTVGDYKLKMEQSSDYWINVSKDATMPVIGTKRNFKLVFDVDASKMDPRVKVSAREVNFTITAVDIECPIEANTKITANAGDDLFDVLKDEGYEVEVDVDDEQEGYLGQWRLEVQNEDGDWVKHRFDFEIPEGETKCRLFFFNSDILYGAPSSVEFTVVGTKYQWSKKYLVILELIF